MMQRLQDKVVVVTGAAGAIGRALCHALAAHGCRLGLVGRHQQRLEALAAELGSGATRGSPSRTRTALADKLPVAPTANVVAFCTIDVRERAAVHAAMKHLSQELGPIDVLVHSAGVGRITRADAPHVADLEEMLAVNYLGGVYCLEAVLPAMLARGSGQFVAISSLAALRGMSGAAGYSASKAALAVFTESLRPALRRRGIATTTCFLGFVRTPLSAALPFDPRLWMIGPEQAAGHVLRAILHRRREAYFPWYDAWGASLLRRLPAWAVDAVMSRLGRVVLQGDG